MFRLPTTLIALTLTLFAAGCSSDDRNPVATSTGWLGPLVSMKQISGTGSDQVFVAQNAAGTKIETVYMEPVEIIVAPGTNLSTIDHGDIDAMRRALDGMVRQALAGKLRFAEKPAPDVALFRVALTKVRIGNTGRFSGITARANLRFEFAETRIETELRDGGTNARRAATLASLPAEAAPKGLQDTWSELPARFSALSRRMADQVDAAIRALATAKPADPPAK
jgi:hypothetical protein